MIAAVVCVCVHAIEEVADTDANADANADSGRIGVREMRDGGNEEWRSPDGDASKVESRKCKLHADATRGKMCCACASLLQCAHV